MTHSGVTGEKTHQTGCFLNMSSEMFGWMRFDREIVALNPAWEKVLGFTRVELQNHQWTELIHPSDKQHTLNQIEKLKSVDSATVSFENRYLCKNASYKWLRWHVNKPLKGAQYYVVAKDITKQKQLESKVKQSESRYQKLAVAHTQERDLLHTLMDSSPDHIYFKDTESKFIRINRALANQFGLKNPADAQQKTDFDFFTREHAQQAYRDERNIIESGKPVEGKQEKETWPDGQDTWVSTTKVPIRDRDGRIQGTCGISRDMTQYYRAEQALRDSEAKWRSLVQSVPDIIVTMNLAYQLEFLNRIPTGLGLTIPDIIGKSIFDFLNVEHHHIFRKACSKVIETGEVATYEAQGQISGNWYTSCLGPIKREQQLVGFVMTSTDITARKQAEIELQNSESRFRTAVLNAPLPVMIHAEDGEVILVSRAWTELTGYKLEDIPTVSRWLEQTNREKADDIRQHLAQLYNSTARIAEGEYEIFTSTGKTQIWEFSSSLLGILPDGRYLGISMALNITERIRVQQTMQQAKETAEYASRAKSDFLANMSHELRTPLNAIIGFSEILRDELVGSINPEQKECVNDIHTSGQHLLEMINDILDLSKIEAGKMVLHPETFTIAEAVEELNTIIKALVGKKNLHLNVSYNENGKIEADRTKFKQIFYNLLSNAVKFTPDNGEITTRLELTPTELCVEVIDTGIGIAKEHLGKLFAPFTQIDTSKSRQYGGTGLGLALTQRLIELHCGDISVRSTEGKGSNFTFRIPRKQRHD